MFIFSNISLNDLLKRINDTFHNIFVNTAPELGKTGIISFCSSYMILDEIHVHRPQISKTKIKTIFFLSFLFFFGLHFHLFTAVLAFQALILRVSFLLFASLFRFVWRGPKRSSLQTFRLKGLMIN